MSQYNSGRRNPFLNQYSYILSNKQKNRNNQYEQYEQNQNEQPPGSPYAPSLPPAPTDPMRDRMPPAVQSIQQFGTASTPNVSESNIYCLNIIGQIEGHIILPPQNKTTKYEHIIPQLIAAEQNSKIEGVLITLNTVGGDVEAGLAIAEMIASLSKPTVTLVLGGGHSIGVPIAVASHISVIAETATMTIHPIRLTGLVIGVPQTFEYLDKMQERVVRFVTSHSRISDDTFKQLMFKTGELTRDIGTTVIGTDAVRMGLIDEVGGVSAALYHLNQLIEAKRAIDEQNKPKQEGNNGANATNGSGNQQQQSNNGGEQSQASCSNQHGQEQGMNQQQGQGQPPHNQNQPHNQGQGNNNQSQGQQQMHNQYESQQYAGKQNDSRSNSSSQSEGGM